MRPQPVVTLVKGDGWEGLYSDGVLVEQGHRVSLSSILAVYGLPPAGSVWVDLDWLGEVGELPERLEDVVKG